MLLVKKVLERHSGDALGLMMTAAKHCPCCAVQLAGQSGMGTLLYWLYFLWAAGNTIREGVRMYLALTGLYAVTLCVLLES